MILRDRENTNKTSKSDEGEEGSAWSGGAAYAWSSLPPVVDLTDQYGPDHGSPVMHMDEDEFVILGTPRTVVDVKRARKKTDRGAKGIRPAPSEYSTGKPHGADKGVGAASLEAPEALESFGILRDMWNAMLFLREKYPGWVTAVEWFTFSDGFQSDTEPQFVTLTPFPPDQKAIKNEVRNWLYSDVRLNWPRRVLVARMTVARRKICIIEVQRRLHRASSSDGEVRWREESMTGLVFEPPGADFEGVLCRLLSSIRWEHGIMKNVVGDDRSLMDYFIHKRSHVGERPCERALKGALRKMRLEIPDEGAR